MADEVAKALWVLLITPVICLNAWTRVSQKPDSQTIQPPSIGGVTRDGVLTLIRSSDLREQAWGAYLAGEYRQESLQSDVSALIVLLTPATSWEIASLDRVILDSLIRLRAKVTSQEIMPFHERFPVEVTVLLALRPQDHQQALLSLAEERKVGLRWVAACNALADIKAPGFAALLLRDLKVEAVVTVSDEARGPRGGGGSWASVADGIGQIPAGFPPMAFYTLTDVPSRGAIVLAPGKTPIYYERNLISQHRQFPASLADHGGDEDQKRADYLAQLLGVQSPQFPLQPRPTYQITWRDREQCARDLGGISEALHRTYTDVVHQLVGRGLLTRDDAESLRAQITIRVEDLRADKSSPLPKQ